LAEEYLAPNTAFDMAKPSARDRASFSFVFSINGSVAGFSSGLSGISSGIFQFRAEAFRPESSRSV
jgi:hypothetical protein